MKDRKWLERLNPLLMPLLLVILGVVLIVNPDSAAALVGKLVAWLLILLATGMGLVALYGDPSRRVRRLIPAAIALVLGLWLLANPLFIAESLGRFLGILLALQAGGTIGSAFRRGRRVTLLSVITLVAGVVLVLVPMTTSRIVLIICGIVVLCIGAAEMAEQLLPQKREKPEKPRIIDEV